MRDHFSNRRGRGRRGFSFSETLGGLTLLAMIAAMCLPRVTTPADAERQEAHEKNLAAINTAVERFYVNENHWPADDLSDIGADANYFPNGVPSNPLDDSPYVLDPLTHRVEKVSWSR